MPATCPKCNAPRKPGDLECPSCGVIYAKAEQATAAERRRLADEARAQAEKAREDVETQKEQPPSPPVEPANPNLIPCPSCNRDVSRMADACPHCGHPFRTCEQTPPPAPRPERPQKVVVKHYGCSSGCGLIVLIVIIAIIWGIASNGMQKQREKLNATQHEATPQAKTVTPQPEKPSEAASSRTSIIRDGYFGCHDRDLFKRINSMAADGDRKAFGEALAVAMLAGACREMPAGSEAFIQGSTFLGGDVQVRIKGEVGQWWMSYQGLQIR